MTDHVHLYAAKGGQGCTTVAAMWALGARATGKRVLIVDHTGTGDLWPVFGLPDAFPAVTEIDGLTVADASLVDALPDHDLVVHDWGAHDPHGEAAGVFYLVTRACYVALRRAVRYGSTPDRIILIDEPGRAVRARDVEVCLGAVVVHTIPIDPRIARAIDAGMIAMRPPAIAHELAQEPPCA